MLCANGTRTVTDKVPHNPSPLAGDRIKLVKKDAFVCEWPVRVNLQPDRYERCACPGKADKTWRLTLRSLTSGHVCSRLVAPFRWSIVGQEECYRKPMYVALNLRPLRTH